MNHLALFKWTDDFSVGIQEIDEQHKMLFELINRLFLAALKREDHARTLEILDTLVDYTKTHFALEERLLDAAGFPGLAEHQQEHLKFVEKMHSMVQKFLVEERTITFELINFLKRWLKEHILETDMAYAAALAHSGFSTEQWASDARIAVHTKRHGHAQKHWWKFWSAPSSQTL